MQYKRIGRSGLEVSRLCLGTMMFGSQTDDPTAQRIVDSARDNGVNFIDTADAYSGGNCEAAVGRCIANDRDSWVLATKLGHPMGSGRNQQGQSRKWIMENVDASLKRLGTDYIDILYLHRSFEDEALPEAIRAFGDLIRQGKLRYFAISNFRAWRIGVVCQLADQFGMDRPIATQPLYNIVDRSIERELIPACRHYGVGIVSYSPLARGVLTGKYAKGAQPDPESRAGRGDARLMQTEWRPESLEIADRLAERAKQKGLTLSSFAVAWVLANRDITSIIGGPRTMEQWESYLVAMEAAIDREDEALVDELVAPGYPSTPGYNDPAYPLEGRLFG